MNVAARSQPQVRDRLATIRGQVMDSCTWTKDAPGGLAKTYTQNRALQIAISSTIWAYYFLSYPFSLARYETVERETLRPNQIPALLLYSENDAVSNPNWTRDLEERWKGENHTQVWSKCWEESSHVLHYKEHQQEYSQLVDEFLKFIEKEH